MKMKPLAEALRTLRMFHDLNQVEAAERLGISAPYLSQLESGNKRASMDVIHKYSTTFDIPSSSILLLAERIASREFSYDSPSSLTAAKILRILDWLYEKERSHVTSSPRKKPGREQAVSTAKHKKIS